MAEMTDIEYAKKTHKKYRDSVKGQSSPNLHWSIMLLDDEWDDLPDVEKNAWLDVAKWISDEVKEAQADGYHKTMVEQGWRLR